ncbi:MAG: hypothetical protein R3B45_14575 [Bdellovibrionota bacterium]
MKRNSYAMLSILIVVFQLLNACQMTKTPSATSFSVNDIPKLSECQQGDNLINCKTVKEGFAGLGEEDPSQGQSITLETLPNLGKYNEFFAETLGIFGYKDRNNYDFQNNLYIAITGAFHNSGGHLLRLIKAEKKDDTIKLHVEKWQPSTNTQCTAFNQAIQRPYLVVAFNVSDIPANQSQNIKWSIEESTKIYSGFCETELEK